MNLPCGVDSNQNCGNLRASILLQSKKYIIFPPSMEFLANLSGCQAIIPLASLSSILSSMELNKGLPGIFADCFSIRTSTISRFSRLANSRNSVIWASIDRTCLSSTSVDLRAYKKYLFIVINYIKITFCNKSKSSGGKPKLFGVDPAGLAPAYPSGNNGMLLYTSRARIHGSNFSIEKALFQGPFLYHSGLSVMLRNIPLLLTV